MAHMYGAQEITKPNQIVVSGKQESYPVFNYRCKRMLCYDYIKCISESHSHAAFQALLQLALETVLHLQINPIITSPD